MRTVAALFLSTLLSACGGGDPECQVNEGPHAQGREHPQWESICDATTDAERDAAIP